MSKIKIVVSLMVVLFAFGSAVALGQPNRRHHPPFGFLMGACVATTMAQNGSAFPLQQMIQHIQQNIQNKQNGKPFVKPNLDAATRAAMKAAFQTCRGELPFPHWQHPGANKS